MFQSPLVLRMRYRRSHLSCVVFQFSKGNGERYIVKAVEASGAIFKNKDNCFESLSFVEDFLPNT